MELTSEITMSKEDALEKLREYRGNVANRRLKLNREDALLARGYRALSQGKRLIDLATVIRAGGAFEDGLPRLAAIRADAEICYVRVATNGDVTFRDDPSTWVGSRTRHFLDLPAVFPTREKWVDSWQGMNGTPSWQKGATVPPIPPRHRPESNLAAYTILWEAEWTLQARAPIDPALLRHLSGNLYVVLATWDLTPLERAVLSGTRQS